MSDTDYDAYRYSVACVIIFGILGNILVIITILRQKNVLKNNYYFLVLHLAICDLGALVIYLVKSINFELLDEPLFDYTKFYCLGYYVNFFIQVSGTGMMLMISVLRYRATVHPLKPAIARRKLKAACGLVYFFGLIAGYGPALPLCFLPWNFRFVYIKYLLGYVIICCIFFPTVFLAFIYFKIGQTLIKQNKYIKSVCSNPTMGRSAPSSSFNILTFFRNRKTFSICLLTVLCYGSANIFLILRHIFAIAEEFCLLNNCYGILENWSVFLQVAGWHSVNPLIYGILDKRLIKFWQLRRKRRRRSPEQLTVFA